MYHVLIAGAGKIGRTIANLLADSNHYQVYLADVLLQHPDLDVLTTHYQQLSTVELDVTNTEQCDQFVQQKKIEAVISAIPYFCNATVAQLAKRQQIHYFDLTEDIQTIATITQLAKHAKHAFVPQCGVAPGLINIIANDLMQHFEQLETVKLRCGALPQNASNSLQYALTWSIDGLINEYGNPCQAIENGKNVILKPLEGLENLQVDGLNYEAFNTSGGIASLASTYQNKVKNMNYKTIRYPGHCEKMRFLMEDLRLNLYRDTLKEILLNTIPSTLQDVVLVYIAVHGQQKGSFCKENYVKKFYPGKIGPLTHSAIEMITATGLCAVLNLVLNNPKHYHGYIKQEVFSLDDILQSHFGQYIFQE